MSKKLFALIAVVMMLCVAFASCGGDDTQDSSGQTAPSITQNGNSGTFGVDFGELLG